MQEKRQKAYRRRKNIYVVLSVKCVITEINKHFNVEKSLFKIIKKGKEMKYVFLMYKALSAKANHTTHLTIIGCHF